MNGWRPSQKAPETAGRSRADFAAVQSAAPRPPVNQQLNGHNLVNGEGGRQQRSAADLVPAVTAPRGGGAIKGLDEKLAVDAATGTCATSVRIPFSSGRSGFTPQLFAVLRFGSGNGPFGFGWQLGLPTIRRKTDKGLPRYNDARESDVFLLSGAEDLVPVLKVDARGQRVLDGAGRPQFDELQNQNGYQVRRYRPRIEGLFARIERWTRIADGDTYWRTISRDNVTTLYGADRGRAGSPTRPTPARSSPSASRAPGTTRATSRSTTTSPRTARASTEPPPTRPTAPTAAALRRAT